MKRLALIIIMLPGVSCAAYAQVASHEPRPPGIVIEHAEILLPAPGSKVGTVAYFAIWNGRPTQVDLTSVESEAFGSVALQQTIQTGSLSRTRPLEGVLSIPGHAELLMTSEGIHLALSSPRPDIASGQEVSLTAVFADGSRLSTQAAVLPSGTLPTDHHHGEGDGTGNE